MDFREPSAASRLLENLKAEFDLSSTSVYLENIRSDDPLNQIKKSINFINENHGKLVEMISDLNVRLTALESGGQNRFRVLGRGPITTMENLQNRESSIKSMLSRRTAGPEQRYRSSQRILKSIKSAGFLGSGTACDTAVPRFSSPPPPSSFNPGACHCCSESSSKPQHVAGENIEDVGGIANKSQPDGEAVYTENVSFDNGIPESRHENFAGKLEALRSMILQGKTPAFP